jgi:excisionase family DNA binding protein
MLTRQFMTVKEVADLLKVGEVTVRHWIKGGELRAIDVGREWRIAPVDLENYLQRHATVPQSNEGSQRGGETAPAAGRPQDMPGDVQDVDSAESKAE